MSVKKHVMQVQKNQSTAQDDILTKPDPTKVSGIKHGNYEKLNDKGYVEEETMVEYGDVIFGKITPISDTSNTGKSYRDTSEIYKVGAPGVIDRIYLDTSTQDGYEVRKCCIRSERVPKIGDKFSIDISIYHRNLLSSFWTAVQKIGENMAGL
jgi:DNA-directed RNA polymerase II subunit RPB2